MDEQPHHFLEKVVKPLYECIRSEADADGGPQVVKKNYDDWNEAFWRRDRLECLCTTGGSSILEAVPSRRWVLLLEADWKKFFAQSPKTHREFRWWYCLLASNRRVFLVHVLLFFVAITLVLRPSNHSNDDNHLSSQVWYPPGHRWVL